MRLFRVDREWGTDPTTGRSAIPYREQRLVVTKTDQGVGVHFRGELDETGREGEPLLVLPVSPELAAPFEANPELTALSLRAARLTGQNGEQKFLSPPTHNELSRIAKLEDQNYHGGEEYFGNCLVHATLPKHDPNGQIWFMAESYDSIKVQIGRMSKADREYHPLQKALDAGVLSCFFISSDGEEALFVMIPGASFRIYRDEETLPMEESPVLQVTFDGKGMNVFRPKRYKKRPRRRTRRPPAQDVVTQAYELSPETRAN